MCGISGCVNIGTSMQCVTRALNKLQNRGYDSAGICTLINGEIMIKKYISSQGENAMVSINNDTLAMIDCNIAMGHTRWATHGAKTLENAHPHHDDSNRFSMIHNGIIENYEELREQLLQNGYVFYGQTDTEIVVKYLDFLVKNGREYFELNNCLKGSWAILFIDKYNPNKLYYMKNGSPLIVGFNNSMTKIMLVSEFIGFDADLETYCVIDDEDFGYILLDNGICEFRSNKSYHKIKMPYITSETSPAPYSHWTLKEINDQPHALRSLISHRITMNLKNKMNHKLFFPELDKIKKDLHDAEHIIFLACGTSYHAAQMGTKFFKEFRTNATMEAIDGADFEETDIPPNRKTIIVLLSQSGETRDLYRGLQIGRERNIKSIGLINVENSLIAREVDVVLYLKSGREHAVASTKSFTNQVVMLLLIALWMNPNICPKLRSRYLDSIIKLPNDFSNIIEKSMTEIPTLLSLFQHQTDCFILGKHISEWVAKEGALKIKEISYLHCEGFSAAALKHGPFALLTEKIPVILIANNDPFYLKIDNITSEVKSRLATVIHITNKKTSTNKVDAVFYYDTNSILFPLLSIVPLQMLAYYLALNRGNNPDYPRNLAKVVTVE